VYLYVYGYQFGLKLTLNFQKKKKNAFFSGSTILDCCLPHKKMNEKLSLIIFNRQKRISLFFLMYLESNIQTSFSMPYFVSSDIRIHESTFFFRILLLLSDIFHYYRFQQDKRAFQITETHAGIIECI
jgi:hypothetical protein